MTLFLLLNPKHGDPSDLVKHLKADPKKKRKVDAPKITTELEEKIETFEKTTGRFEQITQKILSQAKSGKEIDALIAKQKRLLELRLQMARTILEWEEEEAALLLMLSN